MRSILAVFAALFLGAASAHAQMLAGVQEIEDRNRESLSYLLAHQNEIVGLELVVADPTDASMMSRWGHVMLRFVGSSPDGLNDSALSFMARVIDNHVYSKGVLGGYGVIPIVDSVSSLINDYVIDQRRGLTRYVIPSTPEIRQKAIQLLKALIENPRSMGRYKFLTNNCAVLLSRFLAMTGLLDPEDASRVPVRLPRLLAERLLRPYPALFTTSPSETLSKLSRETGLGAERILREAWSLEDAERFQKAGVDTILLFLDGFPLLAEEKLLVLRQLLDHKGPLPQTAALYGLSQLPTALYQSCATKEQALEIVKAAAKLWGAEVMSSNWARVQDDYFNHRTSSRASDYKMLVEASASIVNLQSTKQ